MSEAPAGPTPTPPPVPAAAAPADPTKPTEPTPKAPETPEASSNPWDDPKAAQAEIERLRKENGAERVNAKAQAANEARNEFAQSIGKALGLVKDEPLDPAKLTEELTAEKTAAQQARVELAVFRAAGEAKGDPAALLDSTSFLKSLADIDPSDAAAVQAAIEKAVETNPRLGAASSEPRTPAPNPAQGSSGSGAAGLDAQIADATKAGNIQLAIALKQQRAAALQK